MLDAHLAGLLFDARGRFVKETFLPASWEAILADPQAIVDAMCADIVLLEAGADVGAALNAPGSQTRIALAMTGMTSEAAAAAQVDLHVTMKDEIFTRVVNRDNPMTKAEFLASAVKIEQVTDTGGASNPLKRLNRWQLARFLVLNKHAQLLDARGNGPYTSLASGTTYATLAELKAEYAAIDLNQRIEWKSMAGDPDITQVVKDVLKWADTNYGAGRVGMREMLRRIGLVTAGKAAGTWYNAKIDHTIRSGQLAAQFQDVIEHERALEPAARQFGPDAAPIWNLFSKDAWLDAIENEILHSKGGVKAFREELRRTVFEECSEWHTDEFAARVLKAGQNRYDSSAHLDGGLLEVLKQEMAREEAQYLNGLRAAGKMDAYRKLLSEILPGRDVAAIEASLQGKRFKWDASGSGTKFQDDVRLAAVEIDARGDAVLHTVRKMEYDRSFETQIYECKSMNPAMSYSTTTATIKQAVSEIYKRFVQEVINHGATGTINMQFVLNSLRTVLYAGMANVPQYMQAVLDLVQQNGFWEKDSSGKWVLVTELIIRPTGSSIQDPYAKVDMASTVVTIDAAGEHVTIEITFYEMDTTTKQYKTTPIIVRGIVTWDNGLPRGSFVTDWLFGRLQDQVWRNRLQAMAGLTIR